jgi:transposase-like protein
VLIPILYLKGISTGDFEEALVALLGRDAGGLSASTIGRLTEAWSDEHARWSKRDLSTKRYVYFWVDGIHVQARLEDEAQCLLVIIGATPEGKKELVGLIDGVRESSQSWKGLAFYDFPAEHWKHLRTTNVIESSFATVQPGGGDCYLVEPYERTNRRPGLWLSR